MAVNYVPIGYHVVTPILVVADADTLIDFMRGTFDAQVYQLGRKPDGKIWHADVTIDTAHVMISEAAGPFEALSAAVNIYVRNVDDTYRRALDAGATSIMAPSDRFYGDRNAVVKDPTGTLWSLATHVEDIPHDELKRREAEALKQLT